MSNKKLPIYCHSDSFLEFEEWRNTFSEEIDIELAETGADRELDFNPEKEFERRYQMYLDNLSNRE